MTHPAKLDPLYETAKQLILDTRNPTISLIWRRMLIGYDRAVNLIQAMEGEIVTSRDKSGHWKMLVGETYDVRSDPYWADVNSWIWCGDETHSQQAHITANCFSERGVGKFRNGDAILFLGFPQQGTVREHGWLDFSEPRYFAIADSVSSIGVEPRKASRRLLTILCELYDVPANTSISEFLQHMQKKFAALGDKPEYFGMASTLVGARLVGNTATIFNVGDSRAYLLTDSANGCQAKLLSRDHNVLNDMLDDGYITPEQAKNAARLYRGLTSQFTADPAYDELKVNIVTHTLQQGERLLLCSDGLNEVLSDAEIAELFAENSGKALIKAYMASRRAGGRDDFSVIVIEVAGLTPI